MDPTKYMAILSSCQKLSYLCGGALAVRRHQCENMDADPLVWTNQRFIRWARTIDLGEYADNLKVI
ncbi:hypothetical protein NQ315_013801 [Exocentrus adspersus]|uniref:Uncharacterized protein n=1 Tax=Exocentrus adspersus TaxID=1586481 RepID=A0AAV8V6X1_9CUCU|nr:hypothetical protein NQ315_013801 [Exocentrus adspersus]